MQPTDRSTANKARVQKLLRAVPFRPFVLEMDSGSRILVEHPENVAFVPNPGASPELSEHFYVTTTRVELHSTFDAITNVVLRNRGEPENGHAAGD
jgi:hypothetical protein